MGNKTKNNKGRSTKKFTAKESRLKDKRRHTRALSRKMDEVLKDVTGKTADELPIEFNERVNQLLSENKHTKNMSRLRLPTNEKEYNDYLRKNQKPHSEHDWRESYGNDRLLLERHEAVRSNAKDIVDTYLYYCSIDKRNINCLLYTSPSPRDS